MTPRLDDALAVGIDVGGTKIAGGLVRFPDGEVQSRKLLPTRPERGPEAILRDVIELAGELFAAARRGGNEVHRIGLAVPELVDLEGRVTSGHTIDWRGISLVERFAPLGPVRVESDVRAAALAEAILGAGRSYRHFVYVSIGTGISSTFVQDGRPFPGARGNALVLASSPISIVCPQCRGIVQGVLEEVASGPALVRRLNQVTQTQVDTAEGVLAAAVNGEPEALRVVREAGKAMGSGAAFLVNVLDPEAVVIGGGLGLAGGLYWDTLVDSVRRHVWAETTRGLPIVRAALGADAGIIGAAAL